MQGRALSRLRTSLPRSRAQKIGQVSELFEAKNDCFGGILMDSADFEASVHQAVPNLKKYTLLRDISFHLNAFAGSLQTRSYCRCYRYSL